jgi:hypothetical protein
VDWKPPELLDTIKINQQLSVAMNGKNKFYDQKVNQELMPEPAYQKRKDFEQVSKVHD